LFAIPQSKELKKPTHFFIKIGMNWLGVKVDVYDWHEVT
jgi:hypothetical protein